MILLKLITFLSISFGILSAIFWVKSAISRAKPNDALDSEGFQNAVLIDVDGNDVVEMLRKQSRWNKYAAIAASVATLFQAIATFLAIN
jgi:hypothetical protein